MVLLTDRGPSGYLPEVWSSVKAAAAANPDVPTVLLLVAQDMICKLDTSKSTIDVALAMALNVSEYCIELIWENAVNI